MNRKSITQSYVLAPDGSEYMLKCYLTTDAGQNAEYGVTIEVHSLGQSASETRFFASEESAALKVIDLLARGFVFPSTMDDVLEDLQAARA